MSAPYRPFHTSSPSPPLTPNSDHSPTLSLRALELSESFPSDDTPKSRPRNGRSNTVTSFAGFEFEHALLPLTLSGEEAEAAHTADERHVGLWHAIGLVVGMQVGSGIFSSPGVIVASVGSVGASLMVWVVSGLLAWTGARCVVFWRETGGADKVAHSWSLDVLYRYREVLRLILLIQ
jgi:hypothetical protein